MINSTRKTTRNTVPSQTKQVNTSKPYQETARRKSYTLTIDGESKLLIGNVSNSPIIEGFATTSSKKKPVSADISTLYKVKSPQDFNNLPPDHSSCNKLILELNEEIRSLSKDNNNLGIELKVISAELSIKKQEKEILETENGILKDTTEILKTSNIVLNDDCLNLKEELKTKKEIWQNKKESLERILNEIKKELETKIIEIRARHREEILELEEKNRILKVHLADNLKINSWERQQEIDRISNDLEKSLANERNMKTSLNRLITQNGNIRFCANCQSEFIENDSNQTKKLGREKELNRLKKLSVDFKEGSKSMLGGHKSADMNY